MDTVLGRVRYVARTLSWNPSRAPGSRTGTTVELSQRASRAWGMRLVRDDIDYRILDPFTRLTCSAGGAYVNT